MNKGRSLLKSILATFSSRRTKLGAPFKAKPMISPMRNDTLSRIRFLRAIPKLKPSMHLANKRTFGRHPKVVRNRVDAKLKLGNIVAEVSKDKTHYY